MYVTSYYFYIGYKDITSDHVNTIFPFMFLAIGVALPFGVSFANKLKDILGH